MDDVPAQNIVSMLQVNTYPNPFTDRLTIKLNIPPGKDADMIELRIFNLTGQLVMIIMLDQVSAGVFTCEWDGSDQSGKSVGSGVYILRVKTASEEKIIRLVKL